MWSTLRFRLQSPFLTASHHLDTQLLGPGVASSLVETCATLREVLIAIGVVIFTLLKMFGSFLGAEYENCLPGWLSTYEWWATPYDRNRHDDRVWNLVCGRSPPVCNYTKMKHPQLKRTNALYFKIYRNAPVSPITIMWLQLLSLWQYERNRKPISFLSFRWLGACRRIKETLPGSLFF